MKEFLRTYQEQIRPVITTGLAIAVIGLIGKKAAELAMLCNPDEVTNKLHGPIKQLFGQLVNNCGERNEVQKIVEAIPDDQAGEFANNVQAISKLRAFQKSLTKPGSKPHTIAFSAIKDIGQAFNRREIIK